MQRVPACSVGDYDVEIPEDTPSGMYSIRVARFEDSELFDCSDAFEVEGDDSDSSDSPDGSDGSDSSDSSDDGSMSFMF